MYLPCKNSPPFLNFLNIRPRILSSPIIVSPALVSFNKDIRSPNWTWELVTPNSNKSWYSFCAILDPGPAFNKADTSIPCANALLSNPGLVNPSNNKPLAALNAPALKKFLKCVGIEKIVLAICDTPFGNNNKFL